MEELGAPLSALGDLIAIVPVRKHTKSE